MNSTATTVKPAQPHLSSSLTFLLAGGTGLTVAALYYSQPTLGVLAGDLHASPREIGWIPTLTQLGYALGLLLLAPLGDRFDRRNIILLKARSCARRCC
jgi:MFS family permease